MVFEVIKKMKRSTNTICVTTPLAVAIFFLLAAMTASSQTADPAEYLKQQLGAEQLHKLEESMNPRMNLSLRHYMLAHQVCKDHSDADQFDCNCLITQHPINKTVRRAFRIDSKHRYRILSTANAIAVCPSATTAD